MKMQKTLQSKNDIDRLHVSRKEGGRGIANIENRVDKTIRLEKIEIKKKIQK